MTFLGFVEYFQMTIPFTIEASGLFNQRLTFNIAAFKNY